MNSLNSQCTLETFENKILIDDYQNTFKKLTRFFPVHLVSFSGKDYEKQNVHGTGYQSLFGFQNIFRKIPFLVI